MQKIMPLMFIFLPFTALVSSAQVQSQNENKAQVEWISKKSEYKLA